MTQRRATIAVLVLLAAFVLLVVVPSIIVHV